MRWSHYSSHFWLFGNALAESFAYESLSHQTLFCLRFPNCIFLFNDGVSWGFITYFMRWIAGTQYSLSKVKLMLIGFQGTRYAKTITTKCGSWSSLQWEDFLTAVSFFFFIQCNVMWLISVAIGTFTGVKWALPPWRFFGIILQLLHSKNRVYFFV